MADMSGKVRYRMKMTLSITKVIPGEQIMTQHGPVAKETAGESFEAISEGYTKGAALDDLLDDSPVGDAVKRIQAEQREARGGLEVN